MRFPHCVGMALAFGLLSQPALAETESDKGIEYFMSELSFYTVIEQLNVALDAKGLSVVARVDHAKNAADNDLELAPTTTFIFGNPNVGTPMMQCQGSIALDLPQKMVIRETEEGVRLEWNDPHYLAERHGLETCDLPLDNVADILREIAERGAS